MDWAYYSQKVKDRYELTTQLRCQVGGLGGVMAYDSLVGYDCAEFIVASQG